MPAKPLTILFIGDIVGRIGRSAVAATLPGYIKRHRPDLVIANVENLAHGVGVTRKTLDEIKAAGVQCFTSGNHVWRKDEALTLLQDPDLPLLRPANYPAGVPGRGDLVVEIGVHRLAVVNLQGRVFMNEDLDDPFRAFDVICKKYSGEKLSGLIVDFHAEATSEKVAFGWYLDGRASAVLGTHTHVATADAVIRPQGTAYITDVGMVGATDSVIGVVKEPIINQAFIRQLPAQHDMPEAGETVVNAVVVKIDPATSQAKSIEPDTQIVKIE